MGRLLPSPERHARLEVASPRHSDRMHCNLIPPASQTILPASSSCRIVASRLAWAHSRVRADRVSAPQAAERRPFPPKTKRASRSPRLSAYRHFRCLGGSLACQSFTPLPLRGVLPFSETAQPLCRCTGALRVSKYQKSASTDWCTNARLTLCAAVLGSDLSSRPRPRDSVNTALRPEAPPTA